MMLASRFLAGVGAAMIMPVTLAVITSTFPDDERSKGIGAWTAVAGGGGILGMSGSLTLLVVFGVRAGIFVVLFPFLQAVLGCSALRATLAMMPMALLMMFASVIASRAAARIGSRWTMASGIFLGAAGLALMAGIVSVDGGYRSVLPGMLAMGLGMGLAMTPSTEAITSSLPQKLQGVASALNDVTREFGTALGVALLGAILSAGYKNSISADATS